MGGSDTVTGSCHLIEVNGHRVLRDCGLNQGRRKESDEMNRNLGFDPATLHAVLLSHAHIDHCGNLPSLIRQKYPGKIHATHPTAEIAPVMLRDSARIQEQDAAYLNQKTNRRGAPEIKPLYTLKDAEETIRRFTGHDYHQPLTLAPGIEAVDLEAGHVLGSAMTRFTLTESDRTLHVGYAVDLGRKNLALIRDPEPLTGLDVLVIESTYGNRLHGKAEDAENQLERVILDTFARGGKVLIPAFALERAQEIIYHISTLILQGRIPKNNVYLDSPMAAEITKIFDQSSTYFDEAYRKVEGEMICLLCPPWIRVAASVEDSKKITASKEPSIVIAGSGMCENGRILHHLKHGIENPKNTVVLVGFQAAHTLGRRLADLEPEVKIFGDMFDRNADVVKLDAFSAHADRDELLDFIGQTGAKKIYLVHGEATARQALADAISAQNLGQPFLPVRGEWVDV